jgi:hypothetical protein
MRFHTVNTVTLRWSLPLLLLIMSIVSCKNKKEIAKGEQEVVVASAPDWVNARPFNSAYYIGIGSASKTANPLDYQNDAKKNALNDLASEISVRVQGHTFLNSLEFNKTYTEEFISTIATFTDERIEDFEVVGVWENDNEYWTYYRLNKAVFQQQKAEKKNKALSIAKQFYDNAIQAEQEGNIPRAFEMNMRGLFALKEHWDENNDYVLDGTNVYLDRELYNNLQRLANGLKLISKESSVVLNANNHFRASIPVTVSYNNQQVSGVSMTYSYARDEYMKPRAIITDNSGAVDIIVNDVSTTQKNNQLNVAIQLESLIVSDLDRNIQSGLIKGFSSDKLVLPISLVVPSFIIKSNELQLGEPSTSKTLASAITQELVKNGMRIAPNLADANYQIQIYANTKDAGMSQGFHMAHLDMQVSVTHTTTKEVVYEQTHSAIKGLQLNTVAASNEAYKRGKEMIEREITKAVINQIMK